MGAFLSTKDQSKNYLPLYIDWEKTITNIKIEYEYFQVIKDDKKVSLIGKPVGLDGIDNGDKLEDKFLLINFWLQPFKGKEFTKLQKIFFDSLNTLKIDVMYAGLLKVFIIRTEEIISAEKEEQYKEFFVIWEIEKTDKMQLPTVEAKTYTPTKETELDRLKARKVFLITELTETYGKEEMKRVIKDDFWNVVTLIMS